jgi:hypothetical protein
VAADGEDLQRLTQGLIAARTIENKSTGKGNSKDAAAAGMLSWLEKRISPLRCSQKREQLRSK